MGLKSITITFRWELYVEVLGVIFGCLFLFFERSFCLVRRLDKFYRHIKSVRISKGLG